MSTPLIVLGLFVALLAVATIEATVRGKKQGKAAAARNSVLFHNIQAVLAEPRDHANVSETVFGLFNQFDPLSCPIWSGPIYDGILAALQREPDNASLKILALDFGRVDCKWQRPDGALTIYDEQAIQNDILVRCNALVR